MIQYEYTFVPRFSDTDAYGIFHNAFYFLWFEDARYSFSKEILFFNEEILSNKNVKFPVIENICKYKKSISYTGQPLKIVVKFEITPSKKIIFHYHLYNEATLCAVGKSVHVMLIDEKLVFEFPEWFLEVLKGGVDIL